MVTRESSVPLTGATVAGATAAGVGAGPAVTGTAGAGAATGRGWPSWPGWAQPVRHRPMPTSSAAARAVGVTGPPGCGVGRRVVGVVGPDQGRPGTRYPWRVLRP